MPPPRTNYPLLFAGLENSTVCPTYDERFELRTKTLGCHVSTVTVMSLAGSVVIGLLIFGVCSILTSLYFRHYYRNVILYSPGSDSATMASYGAVEAVLVPDSERGVPGPSTRAYAKVPKSVAAAVRSSSRTAFAAAGEPSTVGERASLLEDRLAALDGGADERVALLGDRVAAMNGGVRSNPQNQEQHGFFYRLFTGCQAPPPPTSYQSAESGR